MYILISLERMHGFVTNHNVIPDVVGWTWLQNMSSIYTCVGLEPPANFLYLLGSLQASVLSFQMTSFLL